MFYALWYALCIVCRVMLCIMIVALYLAITVGQSICNCKFQIAKTNFHLVMFFISHPLVVMVTLCVGNWKIFITHQYCWSNILWFSDQLCTSPICNLKAVLTDKLVKIILLIYFFVFCLFK